MGIIIILIVFSCSFILLSNFSFPFKKDLSKGKNFHFVFFLSAFFFYLISFASLLELTNWSSFIESLKLNFNFATIILFLILVLILKFTQQDLTPGIVNSKTTIDIKKIFLTPLVAFLFFILSFRSDALFNLSATGGNPAYHWQYFIGVIDSIRHGGSMLWDTPSQYGFLNLHLANLIPVKSSWQAFYYFQSSLLFVISFLTFFLVTHKFKTNLFESVIISLLLLMAFFYADPEFIGPQTFPSSSVVRFAPVYFMIFLMLIFKEFRVNYVLSTVVILIFSFLWSAEAAVYASSICFFLLAGFTFKQAFQKGIGSLTKYYLLPLGICIGFVLILINSFYWIKYHHLANIYSMYEHAMSYGRGFGFVAFKLNGSVGILFILFISLLILRFRVTLYNKNFSLIISGLIGVVWGVSTYFIGRPVAQNITAMLPILITCCVISILIIKKSHFSAIYQLPITSISTALFFIALIPLANLNFYENLKSFQSLDKNIAQKLPILNTDVYSLFDKAGIRPSDHLAYYGNDAVPPRFLGEYSKFNEHSWLPSPLQVIEAPISEKRRKEYIKKSVCRNKYNVTYMLVKLTPDIISRTSQFLLDLAPFYIIKLQAHSNDYSIYKFDNFNNKSCN